jgi:Cu(I)/Ag(I) efflux system membrane fusion protein
MTELSETAAHDGSHDDLRGADPPRPGSEGPPPLAHGMAFVRWGLCALLMVAAAASLHYQLGWFGGQTVSVAGEKQLYQCPMHPAIVQDHPGECPICGMTLVAMKKRAQPEGTAALAQHAGHTALAPAGLVPIQLTPDRIHLAGIRTAPVIREKLVPELRATGYLSARESGVAQVHARFAGWIETLPVSETGQRVERGQVLATVYSQELLAAQQELLSAVRWATPQATSTTSATSANGPTPSAPLGANLAGDARRRLVLLGISEAEIDEIVRNGHPKNALAIRSPSAGYVARKNAVLGLYVEPGTELFQIADLSRVWLMVDVHEQEIERLRKGARTRLSLAAFPGETFTGAVQLIYPALESDTRTLRVRVELKNPGLRLRPGMYGDAIIDLPAAEGLAVPSEAIVDTGARQYLFVALEQGRFEPREVRLGARAEDRVQVITGVTEGETVVTTANFLLDSESRLEASIRASRPGP